MGNMQLVGNQKWLGKETRTVSIEREDNYLVWHCFSCHKDLDSEELEDHRNHDVGKLWKHPVRKVEVTEE